MEQSKMSGKVKSWLLVSTTGAVILSLLMAGGLSSGEINIVMEKAEYMEYEPIKILLTGKPNTEFTLKVYNPEAGTEVYSTKPYEKAIDSQGEYEIEVDGLKEGKYKIKLVTPGYILYSTIVVSKGVFSLPRLQEPVAQGIVQSKAENPETIRITPTKAAFSHGDTPVFVVDLENSQENAEKLSREINARVQTPEGEILDIEPVITRLNSEKYKVEIPESESMQPGVYTIEIGAGNAAESASFRWGTLAINTHKSIYRENEEAFIGIAVLDSKGKIACDADITLEISDPKGNKKILTTEKGILISSQCNFYGITNLPDYYAFYNTSFPGMYTLNLTAVTGDNIDNMVSNFFVEHAEFDVAREGPVRIYPPVPYKMKFTIWPEIDYSGTITEKIPSLFRVISQNNMTIKHIGNEKILSWNVNFKQGEEQTIEYTFDAPDISPYLYELGPLQIGSWVEKRNWMIASDAPPAGMQNRSNSVWYLMGEFSGTGATGQNSNTEQTFSQQNFKLEETGVQIKDAFIIFEAQFDAYSNAVRTYNYQLAFDSCTAPCTANAFYGSGNVYLNDSTILAYDETESNRIRLLLNISGDSELIAYSGNGVILSGQVGYNISHSSGAINSIASARALLVLTYVYDASSPAYTRTVVFPLESTNSSDSGTKTTPPQPDCTRNSNCPIFNYTMRIPELDSNLSYWFKISGFHDDSGAADVFRTVNIQGTDLDSLQFVHESSQGGGQGHTTEGFFTVSGYNTNTPQQLEIQQNSTGLDNIYLLGGEVFQTYNASSSSPVKTKTAMFPLGIVSDGTSTAVMNDSVTVFLPETGVKIEKAWFRIFTTDDSSGTRRLNVSTKVGANGFSPVTSYVFDSPSIVPSQAAKIYHVIPASDYLELEKANSTDGITIDISVQANAITVRGVSAALMITYNYTDDSAGYLTHLAVFGGQEATNPSLSYTTTANSMDPPLPELFGTKTIRSGMLETSYLVSDSGGTMPSAVINLDANLSITAACSTSNAYDADTDAQNAYTLFYKNVTQFLTASDAQTYTACYSNDNAGDAQTVTKKNGILYITYQWTDTDSPFVQNASINSSSSVPLNSVIKVNASVIDIGSVSSVLIEITRPDNSKANITTAQNGDEFYNNTILLNQEGNYSFKFFANDTARNVNFTEFALTTDGKINITAALVNSVPFIILTSPSNTTNTTSSAPSFSYNITDPDSSQTLVSTVYIDNGTIISIGRNTSLTPQTSLAVTNQSNRTLADGTYLWWVNTTDGTQENQSLKWTITIDTRPPRVNNTLSNQTIPLKLTDTVRINASVTDYTSGILNASVGNGTNITMTLSEGSNYTLITIPQQLGCTSGFEGNCTLRFNATDYAGNVNNTEILNISVDDAAPQSLTYVSPTPQNTANLSQTTVTINITFTELNPSGCIFAVDSTNTSTGVNTTSGTGRRCQLQATLSQGNHTLRVYANDTVGNMATAENRSIFIDTVIPAVNNTLANNTGPVRSTMQIRINTTATDPSPSSGMLNVSVGNNSRLPMTTSEGNNYTLVTNPSALGCTLSDGTCVLSFNASDYAGNQNITANITITIDDIIPAVSNSSINSTSTITINSVIKVNASVTDTNLHIVLIELTRPDNTKTNVSTLQTGNEFYNNTILLSQAGNYSFKFFANDTAGNVNFTESALTTDGKINITVEIPNTVPSITLVSPVNTTNTSTNLLSLTYNITDPDTSQTLISTLYIDNGTTISIGRNTSISPQTNLTITNQSNITLAEGTYTWWVNTTDGTNESQSIKWSLRVDTRQPAVNNTLSNRTIARSTDTIRINVTVADQSPSSEIFNVSVGNATGVRMTLSEGSNYTVVTTPSALGCPSNNGNCTLNFNATDYAGNQNVSQNITITVDDISPTVALISPQADAGDSDGVVLFQYNISDLSPITSCSLLINGATNQTNLTIERNTTQSFNPTLAVGNYRWSVSCTDEVGNLGTSAERTISIILISGFSGRTTDLSAVNVSNITNFVLETPQYGMINFTQPVNLSGGWNVTQFVTIGNNIISVNSSGISPLNKSANITLYNLRNRFNPIILRDGAICPSSLCTFGNYVGSNLTFNVSYFTSYVGGNNSNLTIYDQTDAAGGGLTRFINQNVTFYANYTNSTSGMPINTSTDYCSITFNIGGSWTPTTNMTFNSTSLVFENVTSFASSGTYTWNVSCYSLSFENLTTADTILITQDTAAPVWSANTTSPSFPTEFSSFKRYQFNVSWSDNNQMHTVLIEHNFTGTLRNYTISNNGNVYYYDYENLSAGRYMWRGYANDTSGNINATGQYVFDVERLGMFIFQYLQVENYTNLNITYNLTVVVLNNGTSRQLNINITPDSRFGVSYMIPNLSIGQTNSTVLRNQTTRGLSDNVLPVDRASLRGNYSGESNEIVSMNPIDPPSKLGGGTLNVVLITPNPSLTTNVIQNQTFIINATVTCQNFGCGNVSGVPKYNSTSAMPDTPINASQGGVPFYIQESPAFATKSCPNNPLGAGEYCNLTWIINATGNISSYWKIGVGFNTSSGTGNDTANATVSIVSCVVDMTTQFSTVNFGSTLPNTQENPGTGNSQSLYNITINEGSCPTDLYIKTTDLENNTLNSRIGAGNITFSNTTNSYANSFNLSTAYQALKRSVLQLTNVTTYYWLNSPAIFAGSYNGTITILGVWEGEQA